MKDVLKVVSKIMFYAFCLVVFAWTATLTIDFVQTVLPGEGVTPFLALGVFDVGALVWLLSFLYKAEGLGQRAISLIMTLFDLVGVGVMTVSQLLLGGQTYFLPPEQLGEIAVWVIALSTFVNLGSAYFFHLSSPDAAEDITRKTASDKVKQHALKYLEKSLEEIGASVGAELGESLKIDALRELGVRNPETRFQVPLLSGNGHNHPVTVYQEETELVTVGNPTRGKGGK